MIANILYFRTMQFFVLFKDDFGDKHIAKYDNYKDAHDFYRTPSNVVFPYAILTIEELWRYATTDLHI